MPCLSSWWVVLKCVIKTPEKASRIDHIFRNSHPIRLSGSHLSRQEPVKHSIIIRASPLPYSECSVLINACLPIGCLQYRAVGSRAFLECAEETRRTFGNKTISGLCGILNISLVPSSRVGLGETPNLVIDDLGLVEDEDREFSTVI
ncbi:hypothetical protein RRG08_002459 [Elysia crispata]|uniref:Uncharacterized protein n=1 Tax=Elysia crispata TaxID=231223 RepID=A0AAE1A7R3_9GAST|nr:hypothetical protein RRG08_002459 [Elysia crispata]